MEPVGESLRVNLIPERFSWVGFCGVVFFPTPVAPNIALSTRQDTQKGLHQGSANACPSPLGFQNCELTKPIFFVKLPHCGYFISVETDHCNWCSYRKGEISVWMYKQGECHMNVEADLGMM